MSTQNRSGGGGPKSKKGTNVAASGGNDGNTNKKTDHAKTEKEKPHAKPTAEQIRIAQITDIKGGMEDAKMQEKVASIMETTQRSEEDVCYALYECDNDLDRAVIFLLETLTEDAFEKTSKKKSKNRTLSTNNNNDGQDGDWDTTSPTNVRSGGQGGGFDKERSRSRGGMRGSRMGSDSRGWRGREARENERNAADTKGGDGWRPGRGGRSGNSRGGYGGSRGGRIGRLGRGTGSRDQGRGFSRQPDNLETVDSWDNSQANTTEVKADDTWGDWDNEEYTGSLADSKVFTPSSSTQPTMGATSELAAPPGLEQQILNPPSADDLVGVQQFTGGTVVSSTTTAAVVAGTAVINNNTVQYPELGTAAQLRQALDMAPMNSSTLSAEQSQYFNSLSSQNSSQTGNVNSYQPASVQYPAAYGANSSFGDGVSSQPAVRKTRARVPPPSKIPSSAVEMPGDTLNNIGYLDVQFGGLDFGTEDSFDTLTDKFSATSLDAASSVTNPGDVQSEYQSKNSQQSLTSGLQSSQMRTSNSVSQSSGSVNNTVNVINNSAGSGGSGYQVPYTNNTPSKGPTSYQASGTAQGGYSNTNYASTQVSSTNSYPPTTNAYNTYNQNSVNSYQSQNSSSNVSAVNNSSNASNSSSTTSIPVGGTGVGNSASGTGSTGYLSSQYPVTQSSSVFPSQPSGYQNSPSVYGNSAGRYTGSTNTSTVQYSNFTSTKLKDNAATTISTPFESVTSSSVSSSAQSAVNNSTVTTSSISSPSLGLTKVTSASTKSSGVIPNIPMVSQYIQTAGMPFYQPQVYAATYDDIQMMQQRMPHVQPEYYNLNYQTPTSLGAGVRDANLGSVAAYSTMSDGRFTRTDNNSSPVSNVPSTMSQQTGSGGPMHVPYAYFYQGMPGGFQYGMYPQQMATASATSGGQFAKPSYNSAYGSTTYDALSQSTQDYSKNPYPGSGVGQQSKGQNVNNPPQAGTGSDISSSMYSKGHVALNKVNSYDKQSFHSGTPPPFNLAGTQTGGATSAQPYGMYIPAIPPPHHNINMHQQIHQDSNSSGQRPQSSSQGKAYWAAQN